MARSDALRSIDTIKLSCCQLTEGFPSSALQISQLIMPFKFHKIWFLFLVFGSSFADGRESSPFFNQYNGKCFESESLFVQSVFGESGLKDPNIVRIRRGQWIWITDQTAAKNYSWYLLSSGRRNFCLSAYVPAASGVRFKSFGARIGIEALIAAEVDFSAKLIDLRRPANSEAFLPFRCYLLVGPSAGNKARQKSMPCENIYDKSAMPQMQ